MYTSWRYVCTCDTRHGRAYPSCPRSLHFPTKNYLKTMNQTVPGIVVIVFVLVRYDIRCCAVLEFLHWLGLPFLLVVCILLFNFIQFISIYYNIIIITQYFQSTKHALSATVTSLVHVPHPPRTTFMPAVSHTLCLDIHQLPRKSRPRYDF